MLGGPAVLHVEYAERGKEDGILFIFSLFVNTFSLNMYLSVSYTGVTRRNTVFIFLWSRHRNTWISIQHVGLRWFGLYKIFFYFEAVVHESTILSPPPAHLHCPPWCNTIARFLGSTRLPFVCYKPNNIGHDNMVLGLRYDSTTRWSFSVYWPLHDIAITNIVWCIS